MKKGEVVLHSEDHEDEELENALENEPERFIGIPVQDSNENYQLMESFIHEIGSHQGRTEASENPSGTLPENISRKRTEIARKIPRTASESDFKGREFGAGLDGVGHRGRENLGRIL